MRPTVGRIFGCSQVQRLHATSTCQSSCIFGSWKTHGRTQRGIPQRLPSTCRIISKYCHYATGQWKEVVRESAMSEHDWSVAPHPPAVSLLLFALPLRSLVPELWKRMIRKRQASCCNKRAHVLDLFGLKRTRTPAISTEEAQDPPNKPPSEKSLAGADWESVGSGSQLA